MKKALITGISGFVSRYMKEELEANGYTVKGIDITGSAPEIIKCNLLEPDLLKQVLNEVEPDVVFHLAGQSSVAKSWKLPVLTFDLNVKGTINLLEAVRIACPETKILLVGSSDQYGKIRAEDCPVNEDVPLRPMTPYAISKCTQEQIGQLYAFVYKMNIYMTRSFNHIGAGQGKGFVITDIASGIADIEAGLSNKLLVGNINSQRDFTDVRDIVRAYRLIVEYGYPGTVYNVGSGKAVRVSELLDYLIEMAYCDIQIETEPSRLRPADIPFIQCDYSKLKKDTGWIPLVDIKKTLKEVLDYFREQIKHNGQ